MTALEIIQLAQVLAPLGINIYQAVAAAMASRGTVLPPYEVMLAEADASADRLIATAQAELDKMK